MWEEQEDFPRGGSTPNKSDKERKDGKFDKDEHQLKERKHLEKRKFVEDSSPSVIKAKRRKTVSSFNLEEIPLAQQCLVSGLTVLGCVRQTHDYSVTLNLPGKIVASLPITNMSKAYSDQLQLLVDTEEATVPEDLKPVSELFPLGTIMPVVMKAIDADEGSKKKSVKVSCIPSHINTHVRKPSVKNGMLLYGNVSSIEDHGYQIDVGITGIQAFLAKEEATKFIEQQQNGFDLFIGQPIWCVVQMKDPDSENAGENRAVKVSIDPHVVKTSRLPDSSTMNTLLPGTKVEVQVSDVKDLGLSVTFQDFEGIIHSSQLPKEVASYSTGKQLLASILYVHPESKTVHLTALPHIVRMDGKTKDLFKGLEIGAILDAKVTNIIRKKGLYLLLQNGSRGFVAVSQIAGKNNVPDLTKFKVGSDHQCRVVQFNYMEGVAIVSMKRSVIKEKFMTVADIVPGSLVKGEVQDVHKTGVAVKLSKKIFSFIPCAHLADVTIKHPEKKFEKGMSVMCRVMSVNVEKSRVKLTLKQSFLKPKLPLITDYNQFHPNMEVEGIIVAIKRKTVVVGFCNEIKGYIPLKNVSTNPSTLFYDKQVIRCRVVHCDPSERKLRLSLNLDYEEMPMKIDKEESKQELSIGQMTRARIIGILKDGFKVLLLPNNGTARLPFHHLSDFNEVQELRKSAYDHGTVLEKVTIFHSKHLRTVTMKESIIRAAEKGLLPENFESLKVGMILPAVVVDHKEFGILIEIAGGYGGLCPNKILPYVQQTRLGELYMVGQSVMVNVTKIRKGQNVFVGSLRGDACHTGDIQDSVTLLKDYLQGRKDAMDTLFENDDTLTAYKNLSVGSVVELTISTVHGKGVVGELESGAKALVVKDHFGSIIPKAGEKHKAVVLHIDALTPCLELSLIKKLVKAAGHPEKEQKNRVKTGQFIKADLMLLRSEFMLMSLRGHAFGELVYVPAKKHLNDVELKSAYKFGMFSDVGIKEVSDIGVVGILKMFDPESVTKHSGSHKVQIGQVIDAKIKVVHPMQMNIVMLNGHCVGRVHVTEVTDDIIQAENPLHRYQPHQTVTVRVIGLRDPISQSYLPISSPKAGYAALECSLRVSVLESVEEITGPRSESEIKIGDEVSVYVHKKTVSRIMVQVTTTIQGWIDLFNYSDDPVEINNASKNLKVGQAFIAKVIGKDSQDNLILSRKENREKGKWVIGQVFRSTPSEGTFVKMIGGRKGIIKGPPASKRSHGKFVKCFVQDDSSPAMCILSWSEESVNKPLKEKAKKRKLTDDISSPEKVTAKKTAIPDLKLPKLSIEGFSWHDDDDDAAASKAQQNENEKTGSGDDDDDEDDDGNIDGNAKQKKPRKRDREKMIQEYEKKQLQGGSGPKSADDFERLVLQSPNSSVVWLSYMAYHVELGEIEKARTVAERALNAIVFREEQEKKNVWLGYLNMETLYGDISDVKKLLVRAVMYNDPVDISLKMCDIYVGADKIEEAEQLYITLTNKYKRQRVVWKSYALYLFKAGRLPAARNLLQRCLTVLDKKDHVDVICRFAFLEFAHGDAERGRTMFENLIASYPGRTDLWSVYVDMVVKSGDITGARQLLERAVKQKMNTKKLAFLVQKYIKFEETHGTEEQVQLVKDLAASLFDL